jgi:phosphatidate phosphatase APP1
MKILLAIILLTPALSWSSFIVISDVDDTVKITNTVNLRRGIWRGVFSSAVFAGTPELYGAWNEQAHGIYFVSASPKIVHNKIQRMFRRHNIPFSELFTRTKLREDKFDFKVRVITEIVQRYPRFDIVLIGDDIDLDPEVYSEIERRFPEQVVVTYIRPVRRRDKPYHHVPYLTAIDVAFNEKNEGRINDEDFAEVLGAVLEDRRRRIFPRFLWCPTNISNTNLPLRLLIDNVVIERIETICLRRRR